MLVDIEFRHPGPVVGLVLTVVGHRGPLVPERIEQGMYLCGHWSIDQLGVSIRERWREKNIDFLDFDTSGVCDNPEQPVIKFGLRERPEPFFITYVEIKRADEPREGGWRWEKWGPYIGTHKPQCRYLHDEPEIDKVFTYSVYEVEEMTA